MSITDFEDPFLAPQNEVLFFALSASISIFISIHQHLSSSISIHQKLLLNLVHYQ